MDPTNDVFNADCPGRQVLDHLTSRWGVLILVGLKDSPLRFHQLRDSIGGISEKMLAQTLRVLARDGLLDRFVEPTNPPRVSYALTPLGKRGVAPLCSLVEWIATSTPEITAAQELYDRSASA